MKQKSKVLANEPTHPNWTLKTEVKPIKKYTDERKDDVGDDEAVKAFADNGMQTFTSLGKKTSLKEEPHHIESENVQQYFVKVMVVEFRPKHQMAIHHEKDEKTAHSI